MTARPHVSSIRAHVPPVPLAPPPVPPALSPVPLVPPPAPSDAMAPPVVGAAAIARARAPSRSAWIALSVSAFIAVAGVSFAVGRLSVGDAPSTRAAASLAAGSGQTLQRSSGALSAGETTPPLEVPSGLVPADAAAMTAATPEAATTSAASGSIELVDPAQAAAADGPALPPDGFAGGPGGPGSGPGGLQGTVVELTDSSLIVALADGSTQTVDIDATTAWLRQQPVTAADVSPGDTVTVRLPFTGMGDVDGGDAPVAVQVTVTAPQS